VRTRGLLITGVSAIAASLLIEGRVLSLYEASDLATPEWLPVTRPPQLHSR
jgi:hypothetical protein